MNINTQTLLLSLLALVISGAFTVAPSVSAAVLDPACSLWVTSKAGKVQVANKAEVLIQKGEALRLDWTSTNAKRAFAPNNFRVMLNGSSATIPLEKTGTFTYRFTDGEKETKCAFTARVASSESNSLSTAAKLPVTVASTTGFKEDSAVTADTALVVNLIPLLSAGAARANAVVPVSYLQVINIGKETASISGFTLVQNGTASTDAIVGLSAVDNTGLYKNSISTAEKSLSFTNGKAFIPINAPIEPGQSKLFTLKAKVTPVSALHYAKQLKLDVAGAKANAPIKSEFPIRGTTWTIAI